MTEFSFEDKFELPSRVMFASNFDKLLIVKFSGLVEGLSLTDDQRDFLTKSTWFEATNHRFNSNEAAAPTCPLPLSEADSFSVVAVSAQDTPDGLPNDHAKPRGAFSIEVELFRDGSPFIFDDDIDAGVRSTEYRILTSPDAAPVLISQEILEWNSGSGGHAFGSWRDIAQMTGAGRDRLIRPMSDQDCDNLLTGLMSAPVDTEKWVFDLTHDVFGRKTARAF